MAKEVKPLTNEEKMEFIKKMSALANNQNSGRGKSSVLARLGAAKLSLLKAKVADKDSNKNK